MNKHILLVMKWLKNPESVSQEELEANCKSAYAGAVDAGAAEAAASYLAAAYAAAWIGADADAQHWVDVYFERTGENKADYIKELNNVK